MARIRGIDSPESLCKFGSFALVRALVKATPASSRWDVRGKRATAQRDNDNKVQK